MPLSFAHMIYLQRLKPTYEKISHNNQKLPGNKLAAECSTMWSAKLALIWEFFKLTPNSILHKGPHNPLSSRSIPCVPKGPQHHPYSPLKGPHMPQATYSGGLRSTPEDSFAIEYLHSPRIWSCRTQGFQFRLMTLEA